MNQKTDVFVETIQLTEGCKNVFNQFQKGFEISSVTHAVNIMGECTFLIAQMNHNTGLTPEFKQKAIANLLHIENSIRKIVEEKYGSKNMENVEEIHTDSEK